jgi:hypothetical protein
VSDLLQALTGCDCCLDAREHGLYVRDDSGRMLCSACWVKAGRPWPRRPPTIVELHAAESATRERMLKRGGTDRHLVRDGHS